MLPRQFGVLSGQSRKRPHDHFYGPTAPRPTKVARYAATMASAAQAATNASTAALQARSFREQQAVLNLEQFARQTPELDVSGDKIDNLVNQLIAEAPPAVTSSILGDEEKLLLTLKDLIERRLPLVRNQSEPRPKRNGEVAKA